MASMLAPPGVRRPRGSQAGSRLTLQRGSAGAAQPHASWWGEEGIPRVGGAVQVLHEDGFWYPGRLSQCDGNKWHIDFEDGDKDTYTLPHRDVKVMRKRPVSGEEWQSCMKRYNGMSSIMSQEQLRDDYCDKARRQLKEAVATRHRKPCEAYNEDGTPKEGAASSLPPYPSSADSTGGNSISKDAQDQSADNSAGPALLNFSNFLKSEPDSGWESRKRVRRGFEHQLADCIRSRYPEARFVSQLQELERKVDAISTRKRMQVEESLRHPGTCTRTLQLVMWNTHENQDSAGKSIDEEADLGGGQASCSAEGSAGSGGGKPSWTLFITGRVVDANGEEITGEGQATLASLLERVFIQLPAHLYPDSHAIEWNRWDGVCKGLKEEQAASGGNATGFSIKREGAEECKVRVMLHCASNPKRFSLSGNPELGELLGFESGSWSQLLVAFWAYVQEHSLHSDDDVLHIQLDEPLRQIFGEERLPLRRVSERLSEMATQEQPIEILYPVLLKGEARPLVFEALVQVEDPVMHHMRELLQNSSTGDRAQEEQELDEQIAQLVSKVETHKRRFDFMRALADRPMSFLHDLVCGLALDLRTIRCEGSSRYGALGEVNLERSDGWQQPWTEEAVLHYLNMQGYHVPLKLEDSLLEEDALALLQQDVAVKHGGLLSREAIARYPPQIPGYWANLSSGQPRSAGRGGGASGGGGGGGDDEGEFHCKKCNRRFKSHHALSVHFATSSAHKDEKDELKASGWKLDGVADTAGGAPAQSVVERPSAAAGGEFKERGGINWNDMQRQMKGKGFSQEEIKNQYKYIKEMTKHD